MTYKQLLYVLISMTDEQLEMDLTIEVDDEFYPAELMVTKETDALDQNHPYFKRREDNDI